MNYYTSNIILSLMALLVLCVMISENDRFKKKEKRLFYLTCLFIALSSIAEWVGLQLNGVESLPKWPLLLAKCADYTLSPMAGGSLIWLINRRGRRNRILQYILGFNALFQIVACLSGWMIKIDEHNRYSHGPLYVVYVLVYLSVIAIIIVEFAFYGKSFRKQNRISLYAIMVLIVAGIAAQELFGSEYRTAYVALSLGVILLFIHYSEFYQMASDDKLRKQEILISTDSLTGMLNRYAYAKTLEKYDGLQRLPESFCAFSIDINGLKMANDTLGHAVGDELICGAAECIKNVFKKSGKCFRTGGDEFIVFASLERKKADGALDRLKSESAGWTGEGIDSLSLAAGYALAADHPGISAEKLVVEADRAMYTEKNEFYRVSGKDRRTY
jgi:diguanylate cyclase (GGDEF)-like protein